VPAEDGFTYELHIGIPAVEPIPNLCCVLETARKFIPPILLLFGVGWAAVLWEEPQHHTVIWELAGSQWERESCMWFGGGLEG